MTHLFSGLRRKFEQRAKYRRTLNEFLNMPDYIARDLNIHSGNAQELAYRAVYG